MTWGGNHAPRPLMRRDDIGAETECGISADANAEWADDALGHHPTNRLFTDLPTTGELVDRQRENIRDHDTGLLPDVVGSGRVGVNRVHLP